MNESVASEATISLTPRAIEAIKNIRTKDGLGTQALRVAVVGGGCSGFSYQLDFSEAPHPGDAVFEFDGLQVLLDGESTQYLAGIEIDYVNSLSGGGFKFHNPKATQTCGCGSSFSA
jgi:iron-sulfur cluster insertion protein